MSRMRELFPVHENIFNAIIDERHRQDEKWGGPDHDDKHSYGDWIIYLVQHLAKASLAVSRQRYRYQLVRIAALAVAAIESFDRKYPDVAEEANK
jgi:hypothetical protein